MSDANVKDDLARAAGLTRKMAAARLVEKEELVAARTRLEEKRAEVEALPDAPGKDELLVEISARLASTTVRLGEIEADLQRARTELGELSRMGGQAARLEVDALTASLTPDPVAPTAEQQALANVRAHLRELEASARLDAELASLAGADDAEATAGGPRAPSGPPPAPTPPARPSREEADALARQEFEALRARRAGQAPAPSGDAHPVDGDPAPPRPPKKTL